MVLIKLIPVILCILILIVIAISVFSVFTTIRDKMVELSANIKTTTTNIWKWITDDYWIKLDKEMEITYVDEQTR